MPLESSDAFRDIVLILGAATLAGLIAITLRQPLVVAFIVVGLLVGPSGLGVVTATETVELFGRMGIALLLFVVGLRLDPSLIRTAGAVALVSGIGQVVITAVLGFALAIAMGIAFLPAVYISLALTFSSTVIIVKLLSDRREIDSLHGRIALGILIVQDIMVILALALLSGLGTATAGGGVLTDLLLTGLRGGGLIVLLIAARFVIPHLEGRISSTPEMLVLGGIAWAVAMAVGAEWAGFSLEMGAFLAGIAVAGRPPRQLVEARLVSLRDFLLLFFFVSLGAQLELKDLQNQMLPALLLSTFVLVGNPLIVWGIMVSMRFRTRTGLFAGLALAQISEFSFVLMALGLSLGHVGESDLALVTLVGLITFGASTYMITYANGITRYAQPFLRRFERHVPHPEEEVQTIETALSEVVVFGTGRLGTVLLTRLREHGINALGVDFDPVAVRRLQDLGFRVRFGDAGDPDFVAMLPLSAMRIAVSTIRVSELELTLLQALRRHGFLGPVILTSPTAGAAGRLDEAGATFVLLPYEAAGERATEMVQGALADPDYLDRIRAEPRAPVLDEPEDTTGS